MLHRHEILAGISKIIQFQRERQETIEHHIHDVEKMNDIQLCKIFFELTGSPISPLGDDKFKINDIKNYSK